jgi:hypothetical protein
MSEAVRIDVAVSWQTTPLFKRSVALVALGSIVMLVISDPSSDASIGRRRSEASPLPSTASTSSLHGDTVTNSKNRGCDLCNVSVFTRDQAVTELGDDIFERLAITIDVCDRQYARRANETDR